VPTRDRRARAIGRRGPPGEHFAQIPVDVLTSEACRSLPHAAFKILVILASQYRGAGNSKRGGNGTLALTDTEARKYGINSRHTVYASLAELETRGLILKTREGLRSKTHFALYALNWRHVDNRNGWPLDRPEPPTRTWETWTADDSLATKAARRQRDHAKRERAAAKKERDNVATGRPIRFPDSGNDSENLLSGFRESSLPESGNEERKSFPDSTPERRKSLPDSGNTLRFSERPAPAAVTGAGRARRPQP